MPLLVFYRAFCLPAIARSGEPKLGRARAERASLAVANRRPNRRPRRGTYQVWLIHHRSQKVKVEGGVRHLLFEQVLKDQRESTIPCRGEHVLFLQVHSATAD